MPENVLDNSSPRRRSTVSTSPSLVFSAMLPVKPSQTITSALPLYTSRASTLPMKCSDDALSSWCASRISSLPLLSSSPIDSSPMRGRSMPSETARRPRPSRANCSRCGGRHSTLAPTSSRIAEAIARSEWSPPAPADRRPAACRTRRAPPSPSRRCGRRSPAPRPRRWPPRRPRHESTRAACAAAPPPAPRPCR